MFFGYYTIVGEQCGYTKGNRISYVESVWAGRRQIIVYRGLTEKFRQNPDLRNGAEPVGVRTDGSTSGFCRELKKTEKYLSLGKDLVRYILKSQSS